MKTYRHLFEKVTEYENIKKAIHHAARGKRSRDDVMNILDNEDFHINEIRSILLNKTFHVPHHKPCRIEDGIMHKKRTIIKPYYKYEQIIHHAVVQVIQPIIMKGMYEYSCGSIPKRGAYHGKKYIEKFIRNHNADIKYCMKLDIHHFFPTIPHDKLMCLVKKNIRDPEMIWLIQMIIDSYEDSPGRGIPIGYYTSQWLSNWYLQDLDHFIKEELHAKCYVRYADDMVIFGSNKKELHQMMHSIIEYVNLNLGMEIKNNYQIFRFNHQEKDGKDRGRDLDFMGYRFYRNRTTMRKKTLYRITRKARRIYRKDRITWYDASQMISGLGRMKHTDTYNVYQQHIKGLVNVRNMRRSISRKARRNERNHLSERRRIPNGISN